MKGVKEPFRFSLLLILFIILLLLGCSDSNSKILGKWMLIEIVEYTAGGQKKITKYPIGEGEIEFFKDKTFLAIGRMGGGSGKWIMLEDNRVKIDMGFGVVSIVMFGSLKGDTLIINVPGQKEYIIYKKKS